VQHYLGQSEGRTTDDGGRDLIHSPCLGRAHRPSDHTRRESWCLIIVISRGDHQREM